MKKREIILLCVLFLIAFGLRFYDLSYPDFKWMDEQGHVPAATNYWNNGQAEPDNWEHPPLRHIIMYGFLQIFGDNPYGWRMRNILFGALAAVLTYLFARETSGSRKTALMAGLLMATDPLHIVMSRYTFEEIYGGAFFLAAIICYQRHKSRSAMLMLSALLMGCALATKWYYVPCWLLLCILTLRENDNYKNTTTALFITSTWLSIPLSLFIMSYYQWFGRGFTLSEFVEFITNAYYSLQKYQPNSYQSGLFFLSHTSAAEWFVRPVMVGQGTFFGNNKGEFILYLNNLPIWILTIPAMIGTALVAAKRRSVMIALPVPLFCASYALYLFIKRPAFIYSAVPLLPFAFTAIAYGITQLADRYSVRLYHCILALMLTWNLCLYPLVTAKKVPVAPYRFILNNADIKIH
jgi:dolichyl-phosphate-mannose--protein O-mannosyl transferase